MKKGDAVEALFAQVYAHPEDDAPRLVLADHLQAKGDPRGEFIALQLQKDPSAENLKRQAALLRLNRRKWMGPLEKAIPKRLTASNGTSRPLLKPEYRRGFLSAATVSLANDDPLGAAPEWATVEEIWGGPLGPAMRQARVLWFPLWDDLLERGEPPAASELYLNVHDIERGERLAKTERLARLRHLHLDGRADWVEQAAFAPQLESLEILPQGRAGRGGDAVQVGNFVAFAPARFPKLRSLGLRLTFLGESSHWLYQSVLWLSKDEQGAFTIGQLAHSGAPFEEEPFAEGLAGVLQVPLRELTVTSASPASEALRALLVKGCAKAGLEKVDLTPVGGGVERFAKAGSAPMKAPQPPPKVDASLEQPSDLAFSPDGATLFVGGKAGVLVLDATTLELRDAWKCEWDVEALAVSERHVAGAFYDQVRIWDRRSGKRLHTLRPHTSEVQALAFSADGAVLASGSRSKSVTIIDPVAGTHSKQKVLHTSEVLEVAVSPDGKLVATASLDNSGVVFDVAKRRVVAKLEGHTFTVEAVIFSPDGKQVVTGSRDGTLRLWSAADGQELQRYTPGKRADYDGPRAMRYSVDGRSIYAAWNEGDVTRHDAATLACSWRRTVKAKVKLHDLACSPDGLRLVISHASGLVVLDAASGKIV